MMISKYLTVCSLLFTLVLGQETSKPIILNEHKENVELSTSTASISGTSVQVNNTPPALINIQPPVTADSRTADLNKSIADDPSKHLNIVSTTLKALLLNDTDKNDTLQYINRVIFEYENGSNDFNILHFLRYILFKSYTGVYSFVQLLSIMHLHVIYSTLVTIYAVCATFIIHKFRKKSTTTISEIAMDHFHQIRGNDRRRSENVKNIIKV